MTIITKNNNNIISSNLIAESSTKSNEVRNIIAKIAKWYNNYECAISLRFDDNLDSHIEHVVPLLNEFDFLATFMTNPERNNFLISYNNHRAFWENELPQMGHRIGNHTLHHRGAQNLKEAEYEIGEAAKLIWKLYPNESKLNVFASGGGEKWNGNKWSKTDQEFKALLPKYYLIDLYDGHYNGVELNSNINENEWRKLIDFTIEEKKHLTLILHKVGSKNLFDIIKEAISGFNNCFSEEQFLNLVNYLNAQSERVWIAPIIQIIKYQIEYESTKLKLMSSKEDTLTYKLEVGTDPTLYDQELSLLIPFNKENKHLKVIQNKNEIKAYQTSKDELIVNVSPETSKLEIRVI